MDTFVVNSISGSKLWQNKTDVEGSGVFVGVIQDSGADVGALCEGRGR
jgi:hypothetical protein